MAYATLTDLVTYGLPSASLGSLTTSQQTAALDEASQVVDSYLRGRFGLPLTTWGTDVTAATCKIAAWNLLNIRGYNPAVGADENVRLRYESAIEWCKGVERGAVHPNVSPTSSSQSTARPMVYSDTRRGW